MAEQQFNPGVSLAGAVDLEALKHQVKAEPGQAGGAPAAGGYVIDTTENTFQAMVQTSATFPILLLLWIPTDDRLFPMARALGDAVNALNGQIQLSRIDISSNPSIAQALQVQGAPALFALIAGRPMPLLQGLPGDDELKQLTDEVIPKIIQAAAQSGVNGTAPYSGDPDSDAAKSAGAAAPDDVEAQLAVADIDMIGGQIQDAFDRLLDFLAAGHKADIEQVRKRLLEYFAIPEPTDPRLARARRRLATLMY